MAFRFEIKDPHASSYPPHSHSIKSNIFPLKGWN